MTVTDQLPTATVAGVPTVRGQFRERKRENLRARLLAAGLDLFQRKGFEETTVAEIAEAVEVSRRTFFRYFESKDDIVFEWLIEQGEFIAQRLQARDSTDSPLHCIRQAILELSDQLDDKSSDSAGLTRIAYGTPTLNGRFNAETARWEDKLIDIVDGQAPLAGAGQFMLRIQIGAASAAFLGAVRAWSAAEQSRPLRDWVEAAFAALDAIGVTAAATDT